MISRTIRLLGLLGFVLLAAGCIPSGLEGLFAMAGVTPELQYVIDNRDRFAQSADLPLADVDPGAVMDDLANLDGCWGAYDFFSSGATFIYELDDYEVYRFNAESGEAEWHVLQIENGLLMYGMGSGLVRSGTFETDGGNGLTMTIDSTTYPDPETAEIEEHPLEPVQTEPALITVSGEYMKIHVYPDDEIDIREDLVFQKFECPG